MFSLLSKCFIILFLNFFVYVLFFCWCITIGITNNITFIFYVLILVLKIFFWFFYLLYRFWIITTVISINHVHIEHMDMVNRTYVIDHINLPKWPYLITWLTSRISIWIHVLLRLVKDLHVNNQLGNRLWLFCERLTTWMIWLELDYHLSVALCITNKYINHMVVVGNTHIESFHFHIY